MALAGTGGDVLNVGLLGAGRIAAIHAETLAGAREVGEVGIFDPVRPAAEALAARIDHWRDGRPRVRPLRRHKWLGCPISGARS